MKHNTLKRIFCVALCIAMVAAMTMLAGCGSKDTDVFVDGKTYGKGATSFTFTVVDTEAKEVTVTINTDKTTVGDALVELDAIAGDPSEWGLYVKTVNGITLDYDKDGKYWAFYIDGAYADTGVDATDIVAGSNYAFKAE